MVGHDDAVSAKAHGITCIIGVENAFDDHLAFPEFANPLQVFPGNGRIKISTKPADIIGQACRVAAIGRDIAQVMWLTQQTNVQSPAWMSDGLQHAPQRRIGAAHARVRIAVACPWRGHVHGENQGVDACRLGAFQCVLHEAAILEHI